MKSHHRNALRREFFVYVLLRRAVEYGCGWLVLREALRVAPR